MEPSIQLVILRLGYIGHPNKAAAGALKEALMIRETADKAVWVVEDPDRSWTHSRDINVEYYLNERFETVHLDSESDEVDGGVFVDDGDVLDEIEGELEEEWCQEEGNSEVGLDESDFGLPGDDEKSKRRWR